MRSWGWKRWLLLVPVVGAVALVGGSWVYLNLVREPAPERLTLDDASSRTGTSGRDDSEAADDDPDGTWSIAQGSIVGYRVNEVLFGQTAEAVGRTEEVTGSMSVSGTVIDSAAFTVDMTTVASDESRRDSQFHGRIMETNLYPTATFELTEPIELGSIPDEGAEVAFSITGDLTLHGVTRSVTFEVAGSWTGPTVQVAGSIPITFADYDIEDPSFAGVVSTEDHGLLEFALHLER